MIYLDTIRESDIVGIELPARKIVTNYTCQYGAFSALEKYLGVSIFKKNFSFLEWQHGWHPPQHNVHPELVVGGYGQSYLRKEDKTFWVARQDQADYLLSHGYKFVKAVGLPIIYIDTPEVIREKGSLLIMPVHSLSYTKHQWDFDKYAEEIDKIKYNFSRIVACVHPACIDKGYWIEAFKKKGISVISGAFGGDDNSLIRMAKLFSRFEYVTTNGFGSHIVYAAYFGAKVSLYGTTPSFNANDFKNDPLYLNCPALLPIALDFLSIDSIQKNHEDLFCHPFNATAHEAWAKFQLGLNNKKNPVEMMKNYIEPLSFYASEIEINNSRYSRIINHIVFGNLIKYWKKFINRNFDVID